MPKPPSHIPYADSLIDRWPRKFEFIRITHKKKKSLLDGSGKPRNIPPFSQTQPNYQRKTRVFKTKLFFLCFQSTMPSSLRFTRSLSRSEPWSWSTGTIYYAGFLTCPALYNTRRFSEWRRTSIGGLECIESNCPRGPKRGVLFKKQWLYIRKIGGILKVSPCQGQCVIFTYIPSLVSP